MSEEVLLGIDIGTSSSKGVLTTTTGEIIARADRAHRTSYPLPGRVEHDAVAVWWRDFRELVAELLPAAAGRRLAGLGVSGIGPVLLPADETGEPLRPAILYGVDTRATAEIAELEAELGAERILRHSGSALSSQAVGPKIRWLANHEPETYRRTAKLLMCGSYLVHRLTGRYVLDHHSASQCDPIYDPYGQRWAPEWSRAVAPGLELPELAWPTETAGRVHAEAAVETGLPEGLPVTVGTVDAWAEACSVGVRDPGDVMLMYGTTMFFVRVVEQLRPHPALWGTRGVHPDTYTQAAGMATSGAVTDWLRGLFGGEFSELVAAASEVPAGSRGLLLLPYFAGERTPVFDPDARGMLFGLTTEHGRAEIYRAALEGIAYGVRHNLAEMSGAESTEERIVAVGGGTTGGLWTRIVSDVTGRPQLLPAETVGACYGDALLAGLATGTAVAPNEWNPVVDRVEPDPTNTERYDEFYRHYRRLYESTADTAHFLARQQRLATGWSR
ncbi:xylulokinase [Actinopolyspora xinjiangensis]|uniref:Xylulokinase n=1 Tax=Actinopolyspora xinjiangensis TaxID=405564 RepID=A0A1H0QQY7_9ACTN|nr:FGGY-family carbohydrate kinase [Actinopolyspora xinjiangensis]SDP19692.1 xylulokinase [Actinopolyspora xinjiangensis]